MRARGRGEGEELQPAPQASEVTLESYARDWLATTATLNLKASTVRFYRDALDNHTLPLLGSRPIGAVRRARRWFAYLEMPTSHLRTTQVDADGSHRRLPQTLKARQDSGRWTLHALSTSGRRSVPAAAADER